MSVRLSKEKYGNSKILRVKGMNGTKFGTLIKPVLDKLKKNPKYLDDVSSVRLDLKYPGESRYISMGYLSKDKLRATAKAQMKKSK